MLYGYKHILVFKEKLKIYGKLFNASKHSNRKFDDHSRDTRFEHKQVTQPTCYTYGLMGHNSTFCKNKDRENKRYSCKNFSHVHANCPRNLSNSATTPNQNLQTLLIELFTKFRNCLNNPLKIFCLFL
ncbi:uncharacterized protein NPIL_627121 [Nephila pilipes]|uniref:Uncharacterized protein n=1 Tax=Nephila pilipes TaxID=299642 RepID=A0A8X6UVG6_NEPPI|nr:uncharacterized protein NPIL_627121 [Nephila pilipes]